MGGAGTWRGDVSAAALLLAAGLALGALSQPALAIEHKPFIAPVTTTPAPGTPVNVEASRIAYDPASKRATATGMVRMVYGPYVLVASRVVYDEDDGTFEANGSVELREPNGNVVQATELMLRDRFRAGFARHVRALLTNNVTVSALYARRSENGITIFEQSHYTACKTCTTKGGDPLWEIVADQTVHNQNTHTLRHTNPKLRIAGHTVAWLPYAEHADPTVKRRTGWLIPSASSGRAYGLGVTTPYFWALAPNYDLTFSPMWTSRQGPVADVEWRHRLKTGQYNIQAFGVHQFSNVRPPGDGDWRGAVTTRGDFAVNEDWSYGWDATLQSDRKFLSDYDYNDDDLITSEAHVTGLWDRTYVSAQALAFQTTLLDESQSRFPVVAPYINGDHTFADPVLG
ncbi:MAG TPA: LPS assembly protein LptD, partial [Aestuariivirga sp.]|nr:LPS assembly protein LptD [Aestuariivirga sp.]